MTTWKIYGKVQSQLSKTVPVILAATISSCQATKTENETPFLRPCQFSIKRYSQRKGPDNYAAGSLFAICWDTSDTGAAKLLPGERDRAEAGDTAEIVEDCSPIDLEIHMYSTAYDYSVTFVQSTSTSASLYRSIVSFFFWGGGEEIRPWQSQGN